MQKKLSLTSRILVAIASAALVVVFFFPVWRIDLFAPQYPEGLTMNIWINGLSGEVNVINGLNHYIGMRHITEAMFPEFKFLAYIVGFFMAFGFMVAITGRRKFLFYYLALSVIGGIVALADFYRWGYNYGHNLDPTAPIQVPGFSYQPPLIGHKRILNFDAYSFPDIGGWIVIAAGMMAFIVWFLEWRRHYKLNKKKKIKVTAPVLALASIVSMLFLVSCSSKTEPIQYGKDDCQFCKMGIMDTKYGAELVTRKGRVYKFDDLVCMIGFLKSGTVEESQVAKKVVINAGKKNNFINAEDAVYLVGPEIRSPMGGNALAFLSRYDAEKFSNGGNITVMKWNELTKKLSSP